MNYFSHGYSRCSKCFSTIEKENVVICPFCAFPSVTERYCLTCSGFFDPNTFHSEHLGHAELGEEVEETKETNVSVKGISQQESKVTTRKDESENETSEDSGEEEEGEDSSSEEEEEEEEGESSSSSEEDESESSDSSSSDEDVGSEKLMKTANQIYETERKKKKKLIIPGEMKKITPKKSKLREHRKLGPKVEVVKIKESSSEGSSDSDSESEEEEGDEDDGDLFIIEEADPGYFDVETEEYSLKGEYPDLKIVPVTSKSAKRRRKRRKVKARRKKKEEYVEREIKIPKDSQPEPLGEEYKSIFETVIKIKNKYGKDIHANLLKPRQDFKNLVELNKSLMKILAVNEIGEVVPRGVRVFDPSKEHEFVTRFDRNAPITPFLMKLMKFSRKWYEDHKEFRKDFRDKFESKFTFTNNFSFEGMGKDQFSTIFKHLKREFMDKNDFLYLLMMSNIKFDVMKVVGCVYIIVTYCRKTGHEIVYLSKSDRGLKYRFFEGTNSMMKNANRIYIPQVDDQGGEGVQKSTDVPYRLMDVVFRLTGDPQNYTSVFIVGDYRNKELSNMKYWAYKLRKMSLKMEKVVILNERTNYPDHYKFSIHSQKAK